ncbi:MAG TPA: DUF885 family protein [Thermoanaerobaculia bacterium]|nr:DUF885 family protein [Thermoanaerobaculia bacterium]
MIRISMRKLFASAGVLLLAGGSAAEERSADRRSAAAAPALAELVDRPESELAAVVDRFASDSSALRRRYDAQSSARRFERFEQLYRAWRDELDRLDFSALGVEGRVDWLLLANEIQARANELERERTLRQGVSELLPFAAQVGELQEVRRDRETIEPRRAAESLVEVGEQVERTRKALAKGLEEAKEAEEAEGAEEEGSKGGAQTAKAESARAESARAEAGEAGDDGSQRRRGERDAKEQAAPHDAPGAGSEEGSAKEKGGDQDGEDDQDDEDDQDGEDDLDGEDDEDGEDDLDGEDDEDIEPLRTTQIEAHRASRMLADLQETLDGWYRYHSGYDPLFTWWTKAPYEDAKKKLEGYHEFLRKEVVGEKEGEDPPIVGDPIGREALLRHLRAEMIAYSPEELIAIGRQELEWCLDEMRRAARDMGFGDDWKAALEKVKTLHVEPGEQPELVRELAEEATEFVESRDLITVPELAKEVWRIEMMSPEAQKMNPFFLGGETIRVSFPTDTMSHEEKLMSMRGNNVHFSRATVHHELIPGHHLQSFVTQRNNTHRRVFGTPFWGEGWALYWELRLYDMGFPGTPEDRIGMLFWRMHRCARIIGSLSFHLETMTPQEWVNLLVDDIGHERENALGEVRRSLEGDYSPLYQVGYLIGGMQIQTLQRELVGSGQMSEREFHDGVLRGGAMPIEMVRVRLRGELVEKDWEPAWRFRGEPLG